MSCPFSPWYQGLQPSASMQVFVAWHEQRRRCLGFELPGLPEDKGGQTCASACSLHRRAFSLFLPHPCPLGGSSAFCTRLHTHFHFGGLFIILAGRLPHPRNHHNSLHQRPCQMDLQFRGPCLCDLGLRLPVHFVLGCLLSIPWHPTCDDDRLPPTVQRLKPPPEPPVVPRRQGRPNKDPPPAPPPPQL